MAKTMAELEKVIKGLRCLSNPYIQDMDERDCENCKYDNASCFLDVMADALTLLKAQEPRVMALEEVKKHNNKDNCVWFELHDIVIIPVFVRQDRQETIIENPCILSDQTIPHLYWENIDYCKKWRCWNSRPTDEQREKVKWE